jgi:hypothetical protein
MKESLSAAQAQAVERAEESRKQLEASRDQATQQAAERDGTTSKSASSPARRQRPSRQGPMLVKPPRPATATAQNTQSGDEIDAAIQQATDQTMLPEQEIANGANGATKAKSSNGTGGAKAPNGSNGATNGARAGANGTRSATNSGGNGPRKNTAKGGSGGQSRNGSGRSKKGR